MIIVVSKFKKIWNNNKIQPLLRSLLNSRKNIYDLSCMQKSKKKVEVKKIKNIAVKSVKFVFYADPHVSYSTWEHRSVSTPVVDNLSRGSKNHLSPDWNQEKLLCLGISALSATMCHFTHDRTYRVSGQEMTKIRRKGGRTTKI